MWLFTGQRGVHRVAPFVFILQLQLYDLFFLDGVRGIGSRGEYSEYGWI